MIRPPAAAVSGFMDAAGHIFLAPAVPVPVRPHAPVRPLVSEVGTRPGGMAPEELCDLVESIAARGDRSAFALLFKHFAPRLKSFLLRSGIAAGVADEIVQETMLAVWRKAGTFDRSKAGASAWIMTIARNLRIDHQRRDRLVTVADLGDEREPAPDPDGETLTLERERDERVRAALAALSAEQAAIVRLSFYSETPHTEIARELGIPLGTVKSRIRLAMARLRTLLEDER